MKQVIESLHPILTSRQLKSTKRVFSCRTKKDPDYSIFTLGRGKEDASFLLTAIGYNSILIATNHDLADASVYFNNYFIYATNKDDANSVLRESLALFLSSFFSLSHINYLLSNPNRNNPSTELLDEMGFSKRQRPLLSQSLFWEVDEKTGVFSLEQEGIQFYIVKEVD